jgi:predicted enzyme related to lactoylglutathione lyase
MALIILAVSDLTRSVKFYREAFGWPQKVDERSYAEFELPLGQRLGLYTREGFGLNTGLEPSLPLEGSLSGTEIYFYAEDVAASLLRLEEAGARHLHPLMLREWGDEAAYCADPDGNVLVIARPARTAQ